MMADDNCGASAADGMRCYTDTGLMPGTERHYRVFAINEYGTSPVSIEPTYATATTMDYARPSAARMLTATTTLVDSIVLNWQAPTDLGGATLLWYCIAVGTSEATVPDLTDTTDTANLTGCVNATEATDGDVAAGVARIVVPADMTTYTQGELDDPAIISQYYRVYAVTDKDGDEDTFTDTDHPNERYISLAASNTANGRTVSPLPSVDTDVTVTPDPVTNLRYVASRADGADAVTLNLYWTLPANYPDAPTGTVDADNPDLRLRWRIEVERWNPNAGTNNAGAFEAVAGGAVTDGSVPAQWISTGTDQTNTLNDAEQLFQVRYVNNADGTDDTPDDNTDVDNDAYGTVYRFRVPQTTAENYEAQDLPSIPATVYTDGSEAGLRFRHNEVNPTIWLDLVWTADTVNGNPPTGFVIDYTDAATVNQHTMWKSLPNARRPSDLGATTQYTHKGVTPGKQYIYRVFPEFGSHNVARYDYRYGLPAMEEAASREAALPNPVQGLMVVPDTDDPQTALKLTWSMLPDDPKGHPVQGYLVQVANDTDNDGTLNTEVAGFDWLTLAIQDDTATTEVNEAKPWTVDKDTLTYTYDGSDLATPDTLAGGYVRWFHVIAITAENDDDDDTGGSARNPADGAEVDPPSPTEASPNASDELTALPKDGKTAAPAAPSDPSQATSPSMPEDLTSEQASDTNLIDPTDRGVLLLWNEPESADGINAYIVQRKIGTGEWTSIGRVTDRTSFTDSREYVEGEDLQYRVGSLGASTVPVSYADAVMYPTTHPETHAVELGDVTNVQGMSNTAGQLELTWDGGENADYFILIGVDMDALAGGTTDYGDSRVSDSAARMGDITNLTSGANYMGIVIAVRTTSSGTVEFKYGTTDTSSHTPVQ